MNTGVISMRYARALLGFAKETGRGEQCFEQARELLAGGVPAELEEGLQKVFVLLRRNRREECLRFVLNDFVRLYCESAGIKLVRFTSAVPSPETAEKVSSMISRGGHTRVIMDIHQDPALIGGFTVELDDYILDASIRNQLEALRRQFVEKTQRIV